ncbi:signal peptidase I [Fredinandcohnia quinoae]|uniref:Signal peptidase I n=1 Tax=Fredinandcohnia quinoae TaxID=2918902 RepID=A0AAW5E2L8_9BACI|nr:signal peptidase I [Fredinandcohnia sp. SECRCQ15]MCH1626858.1 signal peptidase I [Fredinandcohnia sp. SECRCQ15]
MEESPKRQRISLLKTIGLAIIIAIFFRTFLFSNYVVDGESMMPTFEDGNLLMVNKIEHKISELHRFDVVVFHASKEDDYVKRVIGLPGDQVEYRNDILYINGKEVTEPYLKKYKEALISGKLTGDFTLKEKTGASVVPAGHIFVMGDNRLGSLDSRHFGFVKMDEIVGKVNLRYWPLNEMDVTF